MWFTVYVNTNKRKELCDALDLPLDCGLSNEELQFEVDLQDRENAAVDAEVQKD